MIKKKMKTNVVLGGAAVSQFCGFFLKLPNLHKLFDFVAIDSGERVLDTLIRKISKGKDLSTVPNLMYKSRGRLKVSKHKDIFSLDESLASEYIRLRSPVRLLLWKWPEIVIGGVVAFVTEG